MGVFKRSDSLGAQGWWNIVKYLALIGDWPSVFRMMNIQTYRHLNSERRRILAEEANEPHSMDR